MTYDTTLDEWTLFDQVRQFKRARQFRGCYIPVVIGHWDRTGRTHCLDCPPETTEQDDPGYPFAITCDNSAVISDRCDFCSTSLLPAALERSARTRLRLTPIYPAPRPHTGTRRTARNAAIGQCAGSWRAGRETLQGGVCPARLELAQRQETTQRRRRSAMYGQQGPRRNGGSKAGGVIFAVILVIVVLAWIGAHAACRPPSPHARTLVRRSRRAASRPCP